MLLGTRNITTGDVRRYEVDYNLFLTGAGATGKLTAPNVTISTTGVTSLVKSFSLSVDDTRLYFYVQGGTVLNEQFTVAVQVQDTQGETINDTVAFTVVSA